LIEKVKHGGIDPVSYACSNIREVSRVRGSENGIEIGHESILDILIVSNSIPLLIVNEINSILSLSLGSL
jgi:hypothetical protein